MTEQNGLEPEMQAVPCRSCSKEAGETVNLTRFFRKLSDCFRSGDLNGAGQTIEWWEGEARRLRDQRGLLTILNEELGYYRKTGEREKGLAAVEESLSLLEKTNQSSLVSGATVLVNAATTLKAFGRAGEGLSLFEAAGEIYAANGMGDSYEMAALLNNRATSLCDLQRYDEAERCYLGAVSILRAEGKHDAEIALSLLGLAHLYYDRDGEEAVERIERTLDDAWEAAVSPRICRNSDYAYALTRCVPSLRYFKRGAEADVLEEMAKEIYAEG